MTDTIPAPTARSEADFYGRRPDLSLLERVRLTTQLLSDAPMLPTLDAKHAQLVICESLLRHCAQELSGLIEGWTSC